jgi:uncharacterized protein (DUF952 family)
MRIFHIASAAEWRAARASGSYTTSTRGRSLDDVGFIHASRREQVAGVFGRYYRDAGEPLVLLGIETDRLTSPWREDPVRDELGVEQTFPHVYGPLNPSAVVSVEPLDAHGATRPFAAVLFSEMAVRTGLAVLAMLVSVLGSLVGGALVGGDWGRFAGAVVGLAAGIALFVVVMRRRG